MRWMLPRKAVEYGKRRKRPKKDRPRVVERIQLDPGVVIFRIRLPEKSPSPKTPQG